MPDFKITPLGAGQVRLFKGNFYEMKLMFFFFLLGCRPKLYFVVNGWKKHHVRLRNAHGFQR